MISGFLIIRTYVVILERSGKMDMVLEGHVHLLDMATARVPHHRFTDPSVPKTPHQTFQD